jgi:hypothetical protein
MFEGRKRVVIVNERKHLVSFMYFEEIDLNAAISLPNGLCVSGADEDQEWLCRRNKY